jgi:hypothetical protein
MTRNRQSYPEAMKPLQFWDARSVTYCRLAGRHLAVVPAR